MSAAEGSARSLAWTLACAFIFALGLSSAPRLAEWLADRLPPAPVQTSAPKDCRP